MVGIPSLWLPILVAAVLVFLASSVIHLVFGYHRDDYGKLPDEERVMDSLREAGVPPGDYVMPYAGDPDVLGDEEFRARMKKGPVAFLTVLPPGDAFDMKGQLTQWILYAVVVGVFSGYVAGRALPPAAPYLDVFQMTGAVAFTGYGLGLVQHSIWYGQAWGTTAKNLFDAFVYALLTAGAFGWLWPGS